MICQLCKKDFKHLGSHLWHGHKIKAREYKKEFGLDLKFPLIDDEVKLKKQIAFNEHREKYLKNLEKGKEFRFKKGKVPRKLYISKQSTDRYLKNIEKYHTENKEKCPVCGMKTKHLPSHLYNKHGLLSAKHKILK